MLLTASDPGVPRLSLLRDTRSLDDPFGSFLGARPEGWFDDVNCGWTRIEETKEATRAAIAAQPEDADGLGVGARHQS
ncbi:hypothetical protein ABNQ38_14695 (plasmid) [Azospirillum sp. A29]|uniref:hypothetical protein n=1 Tax=Azospirillum sp. A29 TaxID=3160606 RepID=UPI00366FDEE3